MLRLQGFPEDFRVVVSDAQTRKQAGNSLPVPVAEAVIANLLDHIMRDMSQIKRGIHDLSVLQGDRCA
jgi:DNA (cytosine-5)-methyltransferase 1